MKKFILGLGVLSFTLLSIGSASAAVSYTIGLKVDDVSNYEAFAVGDVRCADSSGGTILGGTTYGVDVTAGCDVVNGAGFLVVDVLPDQESTFQLGVDSLLLTVDGTDGGEAFAGTIRLTLVDPQLYYPISGNLKAGPDDRFGDFLFADLGGGVYEGSFNTCTEWNITNTVCTGDNKGISNVEVTFGTVVPVPAAAWLFGSALLGLAGLKRKQR
jgi:hypothetical protein